MSERKLPIPDKCYEKTGYPHQKSDSINRVIWPTCIYLKNGKCQLNACVKNTKVREIQPKIIKCPNCGNVQFADKEWCPDCGARMVER